MIEEDFDDFCDDDDIDCDCTEFEVDTLEGRAWCMRCDRRWWLTDEQLYRKISPEAEIYFACVECLEAPKAKGVEADISAAISALTTSGAVK